MRLIKDLAEWFDHRLQLGQPIKEVMEHRVPRTTASWAYVFGSASLTVMIRNLSPASASHLFMFRRPPRHGRVCRC